MFVDRAVLKLSAGKGGDGVIAWRREKYIPKGGPSGGNGGRGGSVIFEADVQLFCLDWFRHRKHIKAENGAQGGPSLRQGRAGQDLLLKVPCGTLIKNAETGELLCDLTQDKQRWVACQGGKGGLGNNHFKSPTNQAPLKFTKGKLGDECDVELELKLIADVGLVGFPNAGKSTLLQALAHIRVKIAAYPFTTLHPNIGMIQFEDYSRRFIADIPGIIEGAHDNRGLGLEFLRHIERTKLLLYVLDASGMEERSPWDDFKVLRAELKEYQPELLERTYLVALNKCDVPESAEQIADFKKHFKDKKRLFEISAKEELGTDALRQALQ